MTSVSGEQSKACCTLPPVSADHQLEGEFITFGDLKTYVSGPKDAKEAVLVLYDVFGMLPQTQCGADLMGGQGYRVYLPDLLKGDYLLESHFGPGEENDKKRADFFGRFPGEITSQTKPVAKYIAKLKEQYDTIYVIAYCWAWKVIVLSEDGREKIKALAGCHPSFAAADDADKLDIPVTLLVSDHEDYNLMKEIYERLETKNPGVNEIKHFSGMEHGFLSGRARLNTESGASAFREGYTRIVDFFRKNS